MLRAGTVLWGLNTPNTFEEVVRFYIKLIHTFKFKYLFFFGWGCFTQKDKLRLSTISSTFVLNYF